MNCELAWNARRILRAAPGGRTHKRLLRNACPATMRLVEILPPLLAAHCIAEAERLALEQLERGQNA